MLNEINEAQDTASETQHPIINCHTHIFTGDHVAPLLARSIVRSPFYYLLNFKWVFYFFRKYYKKKDKDSKDGPGNLKARVKLERALWFKKLKPIYWLYSIVGFYLTLQALDILCHWLFPMPADPNWLFRKLYAVHHFFTGIFLLLDVKQILWKLLILVFVIFFYKSGRNLLWAFAKMFIGVLKHIPGKKTRELFERYLTIGRFAFHTTQGGTLDDLEEQYPAGTGFVILPMDMEFMGASQPTESYRNQMFKLAQLKVKRDNIYPFIFIDPRRIKEEGKAFFNYSVAGDKVVLEDCFIKQYLDGKVKDETGKLIGDGKFCGFKIYPALGYYPFDPLLLPLWKYAEQEGIPILTHCVRGPMYYRGEKENSWNYHPVFQELRQPVTGRVADESDFTSLLLPQMNNDEFTANFTHPMNFLCLLKKAFFARTVEISYQQAGELTDKTESKQIRDNLKAIFQFEPSDGNKKATVGRSLEDLKICLGHYGGGDEWLNYFEKDRQQQSAQLAARPDFGIDFVYLLKHGQSTTERSFGKPEQLWKDTDWYSIISSMMLQHKNVYADISYILHDERAILPLLKQTLLNLHLRTKVLYGTDFYVVRNHKSERNMLADMMGGLDVKDFNQIARTNPRMFLNLPM